MKRTGSPTCLNGSSSAVRVYNTRRARAPERFHDDTMSSSPSGNDDVVYDEIAVCVCTKNKRMEDGCNNRIETVTVYVHGENAVEESEREFGGRSYGCFSYTRTCV